MYTHIPLQNQEKASNIASELEQELYRKFGDD